MTVIFDGGPHAHDRTLDIDEIQFLMGTEADLSFHYQGYIGLLRVRGSLWIVADADGDVVQKDLADEEIFLLQRNEEYPLEKRPMYVLPMTTTSEDLNRMRMQARMLADSLVAEDPALNSVASAQWYFADPAYRDFGAAVAPGRVRRPGYFVVRGASALARVDGPGEEEEWTYAERVCEEDKTGWVAEKREGTGRDRRLLSSPVPSAATTPLVREVKRPRLAPWSELAKKFEKHVADRNLSREERQLAADVVRQEHLSREETEQRDNIDKKGKVQKNKRKKDE